VSRREPASRAIPCSEKPSTCSSLRRATSVNRCVAASCQPVVPARGRFRGPSVSTGSERSCVDSRTSGARCAMRPSVMQRRARSKAATTRHSTMSATGQTQSRHAAVPRLPHRAAYVLGEIMELSGPEAAEIVDVFWPVSQATASWPATRSSSTAGWSRIPRPASVTAASRRHRLRARPMHGAQHFARHPTLFVDTRAVGRHVDVARWAREVHGASEPRASAVESSERLLRAIDPSPEPTQM
jgi:hypothetical protein